MFAEDINDLTTESRTTGLVGRTVSDVERDLIIDTLEHCLGTLPWNIACGHSAWEHLFAYS